MGKAVSSGSRNLYHSLGEPYPGVPLIMIKIVGGGQIPRWVALVWREGRFDEVLLRVGVDKLVK